MVNCSGEGPKGEVDKCCKEGTTFSMSKDSNSVLSGKYFRCVFLMVFLITQEIGIIVKQYLKMHILYLIGQHC